MVPEIIIIVPYRNRKKQLENFKIKMKKYMDTNKFNSTYKIFFVHQNDDRPFNRGAMKNLGFLTCKRLYPHNYKNISFVFQDIDTIPIYKDINFKTTKGIVKDFYGVFWALHGLFSISGHDFEKIKGFPNFWYWGMEDNAIYDKCINHKIKIDRSLYFKLDDNYNIEKFNSSNTRLVSDKQLWEYKFGIYDNLNNLYNINIDVDINSDFINVNKFTTNKNYTEYDYENKEVNLIMTLNYKKFPNELKDFIKPKSFLGNMYSNSNFKIQKNKNFEFKLY